VIIHIPLPLRKIAQSESSGYDNLKPMPKPPKPSKSLLDVLRDLLHDLLSKPNAEVLRRLAAIEEDVEKLTAEVAKVPTLEQIEALLESLLGIPGFPVRFVVEVQVPPTMKKENEMAVLKAKKHAVSLEILENGTVRYTLTPTDDNNNPTSLPAGTPPTTGASSDPDLTLAPDPADTSGFNLQWIGTAGNAPATGVVASFQTTATKSDGTTVVISGDGDPVNIVPAPPGFPTKFVVTEA